MGLNNFSGNNNNNNNNIDINSLTGVLTSSQAPTPVNPQSTIDQLTINYNEKFKNASPTLFRDGIINQTLAITIGKNKPNTLLVGPAGTGKTKIVEDIARRLANNDTSIPDTLKGYTIYELPLSNIIAGSGIVGELEEKLQEIIEFMSDEKNKAILFIDEIHVLLSGLAHYQQIAQILKPALSRGDIKVIGATTSQEARNFNTDPAFNRRFSQLIVDELSKKQTITILEQFSSELKKHYQFKIKFDNDILKDVVNIADNFSTAGSHRPDSSITLLDRACANTIISHKDKIQKAKDNNDTNLVDVLTKNTPQLNENILKKTAKYLITGNIQKDNIDLNTLHNKLNEIKGQDDIIKQLSTIIKQKELNLFPNTTPLTLLFTGASGVGKTQITKLLAQAITDTKPIILNMTEYHSPASINRIIGSPAGYVGSDSNEELPFDILKSNPYQIILLDEFEKGDKAVQTLFMQAFDEGYIKTNKGEIIDFSKSIIIATSNAGADGKQTNQIGYVKTQPNKQTNLNDLKRYFDIALLNRFNHILKFNNIDKETYYNILDNLYQKEITRIKQDNSFVTLPDKLDNDVLKQLTKETYIEEFGARPAYQTIKAYIQQNVL